MNLPRQAHHANNGRTPIGCAGKQSFTAAFPCPICGGCQDDRQGEGHRCWGFLGSDGKYAHCTREERAGQLAINPRSRTFAHRLQGECKCGRTHGAARGEPKRKAKRKAKPEPKGKLVARHEFPYLDETGATLFREIREEYLDEATGKRSKKPWVEACTGTDGNGPVFKRAKGCMTGVRLVPFELPALRSAPLDEWVFLPEGPKKVRALQALGLTATCNPYGAGGWRDEYAIHFQGRHVVCLPDEDDVGRDHAEAKARSVHPVAASVRVVPLPGLNAKQDVIDWLAKGGTADKLRALATAAPLWEVGPLTIVIGVRQDRVIDEAEVSLTDEPSLYSRGNALVRVLPTSSGRRKYHPDRPPGTPQISLVELPTLSEMMSKNATYQKYVTLKDGSEAIRSVIPPQWAVMGLAARGVWPSIRELEGIIECPTIREDGSLLDTPGWDDDTALLYLPNATFDPIPAKPTRDEARKASAELFDLVGDFPFKDEHHKAAWLAALLTVIARFAIDGPTPLFLFDANNRGAGKGKLADLISVIATGRDMARKTYPEDDGEMRKVLTSMAMVGDRTTLLDNLTTGSAIGSSPLDVVLTSTVYKDRPLATNKIIELPWRTVLFATGNNILIQADTARRVIPCRIETEEIRPEERKDFKVTGCLVKHAKKNRPRFVAAALTILRAHAVAGRPTPGGLTRMDYVAWCDVVRGAVAWSTGIDPCETRIQARANDKDATTLDALTAGWKLLCEAENKPSLTVAQAVKILELAETTNRHAGLIDVLSEWSRDSKLPSVRVIANRMAKFLERPSENGCLAYATSLGHRSWYVKPPKNSKAGGSGDSGDSHSPVFAGESLVASHGSRSRDSGGNDRDQESPESPESPSGKREVLL